MCHRDPPPHTWSARGTFRLSSIVRIDSSLLHLGDDHGGNLLRSESLGLVLVLYLELGLRGLLDLGGGPVLHVSLDSGFIKLASDQSLGVATKMAT